MFNVLESILLQRSVDLAKFHSRRITCLSPVTNVVTGCLTYSDRFVGWFEDLLWPVFLESASNCLTYSHPRPNLLFLVLVAFCDTVRQFGDNHKVKLGKNRSKTNGVKLSKMASGLWVSLRYFPWCLAGSRGLSRHIPWRAKTISSVDPQAKLVWFQLEQKPRLSSRTNLRSHKVCNLFFTSRLQLVCYVLEWRHKNVFCFVGRCELADWKTNPNGSHCIVQCTVVLLASPSEKQKFYTSLRADLTGDFVSRDDRLTPNPN